MREAHSAVRAAAKAEEDARRKQADDEAAAARAERERAKALRELEKRLRDAKRAARDEGGGGASADEARALEREVDAAKKEAEARAAAAAPARSKADEADVYHLLTPAEARRGFPRALAALARRPALAAQPMPGYGSGSAWLPLHCVLLVACKWRGWWWRLAEPLLADLLAKHPAAAAARVLEGVRWPLGQTPLELCCVRGWAREAVAMVQVGERTLSLPSQNVPSL